MQEQSHWLLQDRQVPYHVNASSLTRGQTWAHALLAGHCLLGYLHVDEHLSGLYPYVEHSQFWYFQQYLDTTSLHGKRPPSGSAQSEFSELSSACQILYFQLVMHAREVAKSQKTQIFGLCLHFVRQFEYSA